ncbi:MAG: tyrosine-type recombinase/integrase [Armatimonadota bacterium]
MRPPTHTQIHTQTPGVTHGSLSLHAAVSEYLSYLNSVNRRSPATISAYRADLRRLTTHLDQDIEDLDALTPPIIERWMASMRHLSDATVRRSLTTLSGLFRWAVRFGYSAANPVDLIDRPRKKRRIEPCPTKDEVAALLRAARGHGERAALLALATSGLRRAELLSLKWEDVDLQNRRMRIRGKGDKDREVLIFEELLACLYALRSEDELPQSGQVLRGRQGRPLQMSTLNRWLKCWLTRAGVTAPYTLHSLRRFAAKNWLDVGLNIRQVQLLLGHESLETTILYLNYSFEEIQRTSAGISFTLCGGECLR